MRSHRPIRARGSVLYPLARSSGTGGSVLVAFMLAALLLAAMVFFVINQGRQVNARVVTQHSADNTAMSGAGWIARSFNTVAMNNVAMTRMIVLINTLGSMPLATSTARREQTALRDALERRHNSIVISQSRLDDVVGRQMQNMIDELNDEVAILEPLDDFFDQQYDVTKMTFYEGPDGRGHIWRAMRSLDELSQTVMEDFGVLAQHNAVHGGQINLATDRAEDASALMVPVLPHIPWKRGVFDDFKRPVVSGLLPEAADDRITNRGPYDTIYGWRSFTSERGPGGPGGDPPTTTGVDTGGNPNPFGGGPSNKGGGQSPRGEKTGYRTFGPQAWTLRRVSDFSDARLHFSRFARWARQLAATKLKYVWGPDGSSLRRFGLTDWDLAYPIDVERDVNRPLPFSETAWFRLDIKSRYPRDDSAFLSEGSWVFEDRARTAHDCRARVAIACGWWLPTFRITLPNGGTSRQRMLDPLEINNHYARVKVTDVGQDAWLYEYEYEVIIDQEIGLSPQYDPAGNLVPQKAYFVQVVVFGGVNRNPIRAGVYDPNKPPSPEEHIDQALIPPVVNPYDGFDPSGPDSPAPIDFDQSVISSVREDFTYLGLARRGDRALLWPGRFRGDKPYPGIVAMAQGQVFNNHSWDLWTQMWHAQLQPVQEYDRWLDAIQDSMDDADNSVVISAEELDDLHQYLSRIEPLERLMLSH